MKTTERNALNILAVIDRNSEEIAQVATRHKIPVFKSHTYSLQVSEILIDENGMPVKPYDVIPQQSVVILSNVGVRYDNARDFIKIRKLIVYRADTADATEQLISLLENQEDASAYLADLDE